MAQVHAFSPPPLIAAFGEIGHRPRPGSRTGGGRGFRAVAAAAIGQGLLLLLLL